MTETVFIIALIFSDWDECVQWFYDNGQPENVAAFCQMYEREVEE